MTTHASLHVVNMMTNMQHDFIDDAEREFLSTLRVLPEVLLMFINISVSFYNGFTLFHILHSATYTVLCFMLLYDIMKFFVRNEEIKL